MQREVGLFGGRTMKHLLLVVILMGCFPTMVFGQETKSDKPRAVVLPSEYVLPVIVAQPDCPLQIEKAIVVRYLPGYISELYQVRNIGTKQVKHYYLARWYSDGTGFVGSGVMTQTNRYLQPGQATEFPNGSVELVPLTDALKETLKISGEMKRIVYF